MVCGSLVIEIDLETFAADAYVASPVWLAVIEHVPAETTWIAPLTIVQVLKVVEAKVTGYEPVAELVATSA